MTYTRQSLKKNYKKNYKKQLTPEQIAEKEARNAEIKAKVETFKEEFGSHKDDPNYRGLRAFFEMTDRLALYRGGNYYSWGNNVIIYICCPHASGLETYVGWQQRGRQVREGEKSIVISAPHDVKKLNKKTQQEEEHVGQHNIRMFDISQTDPIEGWVAPADANSVVDVPDDAA